MWVCSLSVPLVVFQIFSQTLEHIHQLKLGTWLCCDRLQNKFEFQGVSSILRTVTPFLNLENITSGGNLYYKAILTLVLIEWKLPFWEPPCNYIHILLQGHQPPNVVLCPQTVLPRDPQHLEGHW